jgi:hypothetical protein
MEKVNIFVKLLNKLYYTFINQFNLFFFMKKTLLLICALLLSLSSYSKRESLDIHNLTSGGAEFDPTTATITWSSDWDNKGWWFGNDPGRDFSEWKEVVVVIQPVDYDVKLIAEYNGNVSATDGTLFAGGSGKITLTLSEEGKADVMQIYLQDGVGGEGKTLTLLEAYLTDGEDEKPETVYQLSLTDLSAGYGSSYDPATHTITFDDAWQGRGWWFGNTDFSAYDKVVVEFEPVEFSVQVVIQYNGDIEDTKSLVNTGATVVEGTLDAAGKGDVMQIYLQTSAAGTLTLKAAYLVGYLGITPVLVDNASSVRNVAGGIWVKESNEKVSIYGVDGRLVKQMVADGNAISLNQGLYIVKVGSAKPVKVLVK